MTRQNSKLGMRNLTPAQRQRAYALGVSYRTLASRLTRKWSAERATGQVPYLRSPDGQRQRYRHVGGGKRARFAHAVVRSIEERQTVKYVCELEGLPLPVFADKPSKPITRKRSTWRGLRVE